MSSNSLVKNSVLIGGLTFLGYLAGGKLGSMLGAAIGTVVCTIFNQDTVFNDHQLYSNYPDYTIDTTSKTNVSERQKHLESKRRNGSIKISICSICLEEFIPSIVLIPLLTNQPNFSQQPGCRGNIDY
ncbi:uncharacterized protein LOC126908507 isoform X2 [Daktulosphaira vitifoliae]|uniref:uncharacterized protein LOC126908507 isoform X2 n=1 Tax=Daktulosphaira vitifoliae TaxID=58002 RepID=UPI0021A9BD46|nr:uncharacterized protein LOC126908507 isoform X2 [Daktulosphaira vitifoliae]